MHLPKRTGPIALSGLTIVALVACGGGGAATPTLPSTAIPSIAIPSVAIPSVAIPTVPSFSIPPLPSDLPSFSIPPLPSDLPSFSIPPLPSGALPNIPVYHDVPDLEGQLPSTVRGVQLDKQSFGGMRFLEGGGSEQFTAVLTTLGKQPSDLAVAFAYDNRPNQEERLEGGVYAFRLNGIDANGLITAFIAAGSAAGEAPPTITQENIGGKNVSVLTDEDGDRSIAYPRGDVLFLVDAGDDATLLAEFVAAIS